MFISGLLLGHVKDKEVYLLQQDWARLVNLTASDREQ